MSATNYDPLLTVAEAARILGYTVQHVRVLIRTGKLKAKKLGRDWALREADVRNYMDQRSLASESRSRD